MKSHTKIFLFTTLDMWQSMIYLIIKNLMDTSKKLMKINNFALISTNESKEKIKDHEEQWSKIKDFIKSVTKNSNDYGEKVY